MQPEDSTPLASLDTTSVESVQNGSREQNSTSLMPSIEPELLPESSSQAPDRSVGEKPSQSKVSSQSVSKDTYKLIADQVTLIIGPHIFRNTRFYAGWKAGGKGLLVLFEFRETPGTLWMFPQNSTVERINFAPPYEVLVSFQLPRGVFDDLHRDRQFGQHSRSSSKYTGILNMQMLNVPKELFQCIQIFTNDPLITFSDVLQRFKSGLIAGRATNKLPCLPFPTGSWASVPGSMPRQPAGLSDSLFKRSSSHIPHGAERKGSTVSTMQHRKKHPGHPTKRLSVESRTSHPLGRRASVDMTGAVTTPKRPKRISPEISPKTPTEPRLSTKQSISPPISNRRCAYCGTKTTPMWRRGPDGAGTLCNACGVKWKSGKIFVPPSSSSSSSQRRQPVVSEDEAVPVIVDESELDQTVPFVKTQAQNKTEQQLVEEALEPDQTEQHLNSITSSADEEMDVAAPLKKRRM